MNERNPQSADKYILRFPDGMRDRIAEAAKANNRSMNAEILLRLEASFSGQASDPALQHLLARLTTEGALAEAEVSNWQATAAMLAEWLAHAIEHFKRGSAPSEGELSAWSSTASEISDRTKGHRDRFKVSFSRATAAQLEMERSLHALGVEIPSPEEFAEKVKGLAKSVKKTRPSI